MKHKNRLLILIIILAIGYFVLDAFRILPHRKYSGKDFDIETYVSAVDKDGDGIDDQTDILQNVRRYIATKPKYKSQYYASGYPDDGYGVCTDVVAFGLKDAGYDLMELVDAHIRANKNLYNIEKPDKKIDFRRVRNLKVYFENTAICLTTDVHDIEEWQGGDIVVFKGHIGIVSDKRNENGVPYLIHHANPYQTHYEEDVLERYEVLGHYRIS